MLNGDISAEIALEDASDIGEGFPGKKYPQR